MTLTWTFPKLKSAMKERRLNRVIFVSRAHNYCYVSNPKAACSTIKLWLMRNEIGDPDYVPKNLHDRSEGGILRPKDLTRVEKQNLIEGKIFTFSFVRDPLSRILSAYKNKILRPKAEKSSVLEALGLQADDLQKFVTIDEFFRSILHSRPEDLNRHWRPQTHTLYPNLIHYHFIGKVEQFDQDIEKLNDKLRFPIKNVETRNSTKRGDKIVSEMNVSGSLLDAIIEYYSGDFQKFGYDVEESRAKFSRSVILR